MCRMIASFGNVPQTELVDNFIRMSHGWGELNELNTEVEEFLHADGWGSVYKKQGVYGLYKSPISCWEDPKLSEIEREEILLLHSRHATVGRVKEENSHPFKKTYENKEWFFCHNGTVEDPLPEYAGLEGETDSEKLFCLLLGNFDEKKDISSIEKTINSLSNYTSVNSFLFNGQYLYAINKYSENPKYYELNLFMGEKAIILSSERLDLTLEAKLADWQELENGQIVRVDIEKMIVELS